MKLTEGSIFYSRNGRLEIQQPKIEWLSLMLNYGLYKNIFFFLPNYFRMNRLLNAYNLTGTGQRDVGEGSLQWELEGENWDEIIAAVIASLSEGYAEEKVESEKVGESEESTEGEGSSQTEEEWSGKRKNTGLEEGEIKKEKGKGGPRKCNCTFWRDGTKVGTESPRLQAKLRRKDIELDIARKGQKRAEKLRARGRRKSKG